MTLQEIIGKIKYFPDLPREVLIFALIILVGLGGYFLGRVEVGEESRAESLKLSKFEVKSNIFTELSVSTSTSVSGASGSNPKAIKGGYVGSKSGKAYHLPSCPGAKRIKAENLIWFSDREEAEKAGYHPAGNCPQITQK